MLQMRSVACPWMMANVKTVAAEHDCGDSTSIKKLENASLSSSQDAMEMKIISKLLKIVKLDANLNYATW